MSVVALFSAKGAPGTTTAAMLVGSLWPRATLLADCDPYGGDVGLRLPRPDGRPLDLHQGMLSLLPLARRSLPAEALLEHAQQTLGGLEVLVGLSGPEQAAAGGPVWATLADAFTGLADRDVVIDAGRLDNRSPVLPLVLTAQLAVCVVQASLAGVYASRTRLRSLLPSFTGIDGSGPSVGVLVQAKDRREAEQAAAVIEEEFPQVLFLGHLVTDPQGARIFDGLPVSRPERSLLVRGGVDVVGALTAELARRQDGRRPVGQPQWGLRQPPAAAPTTSEPTPAKLTRSEARRQASQAKRRRFGRTGKGADSIGTTESSQA